VDCSQAMVQPTCARVRLTITLHVPLPHSAGMEIIAGHRGGHEARTIHLAGLQ
jgi:hypothetical protein